MPAKLAVFGVCAIYMLAGAAVQTAALHAPAMWMRTRCATGAKCNPARHATACYIGRRRSI